MADIIITPGSSHIAGTGSIKIDSNVGIQVSSSFVLTGSNAVSPFVVSMPTVGSNSAKLQVNTEGITVFGAPDSEPTAVEGGIYYKDGVFYVGDNQ
jgi:hypothetical protein|tara:strand:- start:101 stop:388 length:288 start_codon:yes stop_codon:yes gene_type:complete